MNKIWLSVAKKDFFQDRLISVHMLSPELNPDELVWNHLKNHKIGRQAIKGKKDFQERVRSIMHSLQKMPAKIKGFFKHPIIKYTEMLGDLCMD